MRIGFCGKGGSGKSTVSSLFARYLANKNSPVIIMDGDINQHLGKALGFSADELKTQKRMGAESEVLHGFVKGDNNRIPSVDVLSENTPPGKGSGLIYFNQDNDVSNEYELEKGGLRFLTLGGHTDDQVGATCYHAFTHKMGTYMNHLIDSKGEYFIGDMCAGADPFASALASKFDVIILVVEPTEKSVGVFDQCTEYAKPYGIKIHVVGNKIEDKDDLEFIRSKVGDALIGHLTRSNFVRKQEKGTWQDISALEPENLELMSHIQQMVDLVDKDWDKYQQNNLHFFERAAKSWGDALYETDMMAQLDPDFRYQDYLMPEKKTA
jgi:CO dehydrogenase maturation factor